jgi:hypothetical protein
MKGVKPMMRRGVGAVAAALLAGAVLAASAQAATRHGPPYTPGPKGGDQFTSVSADPATGTIQIAQVDGRQAAAVNCVGEGPWATLETSQPVTDAVSLVRVAYQDAIWSDTVVMNIDVIGSRSGALGHGSVLGQRTGAGGVADVHLFQAPVRGETMTVRFGLQTHAGCLPGAVVGLNGSRPGEFGRVTVPSVEME